MMHPLGTDPVAVGEFELAHVMPEAPELFAVPGAPAYCRQAIVWNARPVPLLDLPTRVYNPRALLAATRTRELAHAYIAVVRFGSQSNLESVDYGAIALRDLPVRVLVSDEQASRLPDDMEDWSTYALSCFAHADGTTVPILHLERLFGADAD